LNGFHAFAPLVRDWQPTPASDLEMAERYRAAFVPAAPALCCTHLNCWMYSGWNIQRQGKEQRVAMLARHTVTL
jgi:hypothetical protein